MFPGTFPGSCCLRAWARLAHTPLHFSKYSLLAELRGRARVSALSWRPEGLWHVFEQHSPFLSRHCSHNPFVSTTAVYAACLRLERTTPRPALVP